MEKVNNEDVVSLIKDWSETFGLPILKEKGFPSQDRIDLSIKLIKEELQETQDAIALNDFQETEDGLGDLLWVTVRAMMEMGINPLEVIQKIYESNMSKADNTVEDAIFTYKHYMDKGISTYSKERNGKFITYRSEDNKVLKSARNFKRPEL
jgi:NTP pyrophosphatase (non-canonical NTP hydrolase)